MAATGGDLTAFGTPDRLAGFAGLAPVPRDSGRVRGNLHRFAATTAGCCEPATSPRWPACTADPSPSATTSANATRGRSTSKPCWP
ncbi:transposase [Streptomyces graminofaciens]|uniref:transposase n=1 Tax=Streptomyces graminofaciens TaxID=68212 RepID=UPI003306754B